MHEIKNEYFGEQCQRGGAYHRYGYHQAAAAAIYTADLLGVPEVMIRDEKGQFLDDITLEELGRSTGLPGHQYPHRRRRVL